MTSRAKIGSLIFEVTSACNLDCRYCYNAWKAPKGSPPPPSSYKQAKRTLRRAFKVADIQHVTFSGGEPFLAERLSELVLLSRMAGKSVTLISNGTLASRDDWKTMVDLGVRLFELPLHSPDPVAHERMVGRPGSWEASLRSVRELLALGADVVIALVLTKLNQDQVRDTLLFLKDQGIKRVMFNRFNIGGRGVELASTLLPDREGLNRAFLEANNVARDHGIQITSNVCTPVCVLDPWEFRSLGFSICTPDPSRRPLALDVAGNLRLCNHSPVNMGNIFETPIEEIFQTDYALSWRDTVPALCADCKLWNRCFGGCRAAAEQLGEGLDQPDPAIRLAG